MHQRSDAGTQVLDEFVRRLIESKVLDEKAITNTRELLKRPKKFTADEFKKALTPEEVAS